MGIVCSGKHPTGSGWVTFKRHSDACQALELLNGTLLDKAEVTLRVDADWTPSNARSGKSTASSSSTSGQHRDKPDWHAGEPFRCIFFTRVPHGTTVKEIRHVFETHGRVSRISLSRPGRIAGPLRGMVEFEHHGDAHDLIDKRTLVIVNGVTISVKKTRVRFKGNGSQAESYIDELDAVERRATLPHSRLPARRPRTLLQHGARSPSRSPAHMSDKERLSHDEPELLYPTRLLPLPVQSAQSMLSRIYLDPFYNPMASFMRRATAPSPPTFVPPIAPPVLTALRRQQPSVSTLKQAQHPGRMAALGPLVTPSDGYDSSASESPPPSISVVSDSH